MADYIPGPDASFQAWQANFVTYANANLAALGLVAADMAPITAGQTAWSTGFTAHIAAKNAAMAAKQTKDEARAAYVAAIRPLVRRLQASAVVSDAEKASLGITVAQTPDAHRPTDHSGGRAHLHHRVRQPPPAGAPLRGLGHAHPQGQARRRDRRGNLEQGRHHAACQHDRVAVRREAHLRAVLSDEPSKAGSLRRHGGPARPANP